MPCLWHALEPTAPVSAKTLLTDERTCRPPPFCTDTVQQTEIRWGQTDHEVLTSLTCSPGGKSTGALQRKPNSSAPVLRFYVPKAEELHMNQSLRQAVVTPKGPADRGGFCARSAATCQAPTASAACRGAATKAEESTLLSLPAWCIPHAAPSTLRRPLSFISCAEKRLSDASELSSPMQSTLANSDASAFESSLFCLLNPSDKSGASWTVLQSTALLGAVIQLCSVEEHSRHLRVPALWDAHLATQMTQMRRPWCRCRATGVP